MRVGEVGGGVGGFGGVGGGGELIVIRNIVIRNIEALFGALFRFWINVCLGKEKGC